jgi:mono/diheme cytochrome c family protein
LKSFLAGALTVVVILAIGAVVVVERSQGFTTKETPGAVETWIAREARTVSMPADAKQRVNPVPNSEQVIAEGRAHWADHCAGCHSNNGSGDAQMGKNMYPPAPDMRDPGTQQMTDGELFFVIENGVRFTGMPGWGGKGHTDEDSWKLVRFIRHLPQMTQAEELQMQELNPKSPDELQEEQEERDFLNGAETDEHPEQHHHTH